MQYTYTYVYIYMYTHLKIHQHQPQRSTLTTSGRVLGHLNLHHFHPLPTQPGRRYAKLCEVTDGSCMSSGSFEDLFFESSIHRIPDESLSFCISNLYISRKEIYIHIYTQLYKETDQNICFCDRKARKETKRKGMEEANLEEG